jgi:hypothetical protein
VISNTIQEAISIKYVTIKKPINIFMLKNAINDVKKLKGLYYGYENNPKDG